MKNSYTKSSLMGAGLTRKFMLILVFGVALGIVCTAFFGYYHAQALRRDNAGAEMQRVAEAISEQIDFSLETAVRSLARLAESAEIRQAIGEQHEQYEGLSASEISAIVDVLNINPESETLEAFVSTNPGYSSVRAIYHIGKADVVAAAVGKLDSSYSTQEQWWHHPDILRRSEPAIREPKSSTVSICIPIETTVQGNFQAKLLAEYDLLRAIPGLTRDQNEIIGFLLARDGERRLQILDPTHASSSAPVDFHERDGQMAPRKRGHSALRLEKQGMTAIAGFAPIKHSLTSIPVIYTGRDWSVVAAVPATRIMAPVNALFYRAFGFSAVMVVLVSLAGIAFSRRILRPMRVLQEGVQEIGQGNLEHRIDIRSGDEIETLAVEFNRMADHMQRTQEQLQRRGKELEQRVNQLRRLQAQLMQSERMAATGELAAQIAHEINNPLGIIKNYVGIAKMLMPEEEPNRENLKIIDQEINRIAGIVRRLLKFAKPGVEEMQSVQINQILEELLALLRGQLFRRKIDVSAELAENLPEVSVSTDQVRQVFLNLIKNAEDAMPDGGRLAIRTRYRKGRVEVDIADDGIGIPSEEIKNIFEPFFTTKGVKGTGLGLAVSYGIIKNYNGEISVDSEPGRGTTFTIQLPVVSDKVFQVIQSP